jgi:hypothetical protein
MKQLTFENKANLFFIISMICMMGYCAIRFLLTVKIIKGEGVTRKTQSYAIVIGGVLGTLVCLMFSATLLLPTSDDSVFDWKEFAFVAFPFALIVGVLSALFLLWNIKREERQRRRIEQQEMGLPYELLAWLVKAVKKHVEREE